MNAEKKEELKKRWTVLCRRLGEASNITISASLIDKWWAKLNSCYTETWRNYHTWDHIYDCFEEFDEVVHLFENPLAAELDLFFHDSAYHIGPKQPQSNEFLSLLLLISFCQECQIKLLPLKGIMCTDHDPNRLPTLTNDEKLLCSIDLAILGQSSLKYVCYYARGIRHEYSKVPLELYRAKRAEILEGFLNRERIYPHEYFFKKYNHNARANLAWEIHVLHCGEFPQT